MTVLLGVLDGDRSSRERVAGAGTVLLETPRLLVVGEGEHGQASDGTRSVVVGSIWNVGEVAERLGLHGKTTAAAVVAAAYSRAGIAALDRLRGRYLVVIAAVDDTLVVSADALGARSLHVARSGRGLVFGEDVRDVIRGLSATPEPSRLVVTSWLADGTIPVGQSFFAGVERLPAGTAWLSPNASEGGPQQVFDLIRPESRAMLTDLDEAAEQVRLALTAAVGRALHAADGTPAIMLSGGLDSSSVAAAASLAAPGVPLDAVAATFPEHPAADELDLIRETADQLGLRLHLESLGEIEPLASWAAYAERWNLPFPYAAGGMSQEIFRGARRLGIDVLLTGQGGDETSYNSPHIYLMDLVRRGRLRRALSLAAQAPLTAPGRRNGLRVLRATRGFVWPRGGTDLADGIALLGADDAARVAAHRSDRAWIRGSGPLWWRHRHDQLTHLREIVDASGGLRRLGLSTGIDQLHPYLHDRDLFEVMLRLHPSVMFDSRNDRIATRDAMRAMLPPAVVNRRGKSHFTDLHTNWLTGAGRPVVTTLLQAGSAWTEFVDRSAVERRLLAPTAPESHPGGKYGWSNEMHRVVALEMWLRRAEGA